VISACQVNSSLIASHKLHFKPTENTFHSDVMTAMEEYVIYNPQYKVLICQDLEDQSAEELEQGDCEIKN
jgi:hypothetical protein